MDIKVFRSIFETETYGHADEWETSELLHIRPDLVHLETVRNKTWTAEDRLSHLPHTYTPMDWFSRQPDLMRGEPGPSTAEKGRKFLAHQVEQMASIVKAIKEDKVAGQLYREYNERTYRHPGTPTKTTSTRSAISSPRKRRRTGRWPATSRFSGGRSGRTSARPTG